MREAVWYSLASGVEGAVGLCLLGAPLMQGRRDLQDLAAKLEVLRQQAEDAAGEQDAREEMAEAI